MKTAEMLIQASEKAHMCGIVCNCGPNGEPLACGFQDGHKGNHSWATLPTWQGNKVQTPDLDFDKYAAQLKELGIDHVLEHVKYWRERCLTVEATARKVVEEWWAFGFDSDALVDHIGELDKLTQD